MKKKLPIIWQGQKFWRIEKFDCINVSLSSFEDIDSNYFTHIPISPADYRLTKKTNARVEIKYEKHYTLFLIYDDWGKLFKMEIPNSMEQEIILAKQGAIDHQLLKKSNLILELI